MTDRDRLIELLSKKSPIGMMTEDIEELTDHLLANGVIVPPCKVGDKTYSVGVFTGQIISSEVVSIISSENDYFLHLENETVVCVSQQLGKTVFLTKEEAEVELRKRSENNA